MSLKALLSMVITSGISLVFVRRGCI